MRLAPQPASAQPLQLVVFLALLLGAGVVPSPVISAGCPDRCVCDDQLVVQCAGQHLLPPLALNYLSDLVSESTFGNLRKLAYLDLSFNTLRRIEDRTFGPLASLVMLRMTDNPGLSDIHPDAFSENEALQVLDVSRNNLTALNITSLLALAALRSVGLGGNPWSCQCDNEDLYPIFIITHREFYSFLSFFNRNCAGKRTTPVTHTQKLHNFFRLTSPGQHLQQLLFHTSKWPIACRTAVIFIIAVKNCGLNTHSKI
uniref:LRRNT domain-containing protein n=1 Tax=Xiphophorus couchianus TaxID=32473 RepID=A0A3B5LQG3_9TELE